MSIFSVVRRVLRFSKPTQRLLIKFLFRLQKILYVLISALSRDYNDGVHPKIDLIKYRSWFFDNVKSEDSVLDIGSNEGGLALALSSKVKSVQGIELSETVFKRALDNSQDIPNVKFICSSIYDIDLMALDTFNVVCLSNVLEHLDRRIELLQALHRVLLIADNPRLLIRVPAYDRCWTVPWMNSLDIDFRLDKTHCLEYTDSGLSDELKISGFEIETLMRKFGEIFVIAKPSLTHDAPINS